MTTHKWSDIKFKNKSQLRNLFQEGEIAQLLAEDAPPPSGMPEQKRETGDSIDQQIDRYFSEYEEDAKQTSGVTSQMESLDWRDLLAGRLITEADDEADDVKDDEKAAAPTPQSAPTSKLSIDDLDVGAFANSVVRLIENYDNLLEVRDTLVKRATNFLIKVYETDVVEAFKTALRDEHGIVPGQSKGETDADLYPAPRGDRAGASNPGEPGG